MTLGDGEKKMPYAGPIKVQFENRTTFVGAMMMGDEVLMGAILMEDMDVVIHPATLSLTVNPNSPNIAMTKAKGYSNDTNV